MWDDDDATTDPGSWYEWVAASLEVQGYSPVSLQSGHNIVTDAMGRTFDLDIHDARNPVWSDGKVDARGKTRTLSELSTLEMFRKYIDLRADHGTLTISGLIDELQEHTLAEQMEDWSAAFRFASEYERSHEYH